MNPSPRHRPARIFLEAPRLIFDCDFAACLHCQTPLQPRKPWHMRKYVQTLAGPLFVAGRSKACGNPACSHVGMHYYASRPLAISLPFSTYGLDVLAFIGWQHEHEHQQLAEIHRRLQPRGLFISERNVGRLFRQFLALLGGATAKAQQRLASAARQHGGLIWAVDALQPEGHGTLLYLLYEVLSETAVSARQWSKPTAAQLSDWLAPYRDWCAQELSCTALATLSDGEEAIIKALQDTWPTAPHQRCQSHFLSNLAKPVMEFDTQLRQALQQQLGGLPPVPEHWMAPVEPSPGSMAASPPAPLTAAPEAEPPFCPRPNGVPHGRRRRPEPSRAMPN